MKNPAVSTSTASPSWTGYLTTIGGFATVGALTSTAEATIIYTDPADITTSFSIGADIRFDLDNSGAPPYATTGGGNAQTDFGFVFYAPELLLSGGTYTDRSLLGSSGNADKLSAGASIGPAGSFGNPLYLENNGGGPWNGSSGDAYLGLRIGSGATATYGWARVDYNDAANTLTLKDFAYQTTANTAILAGQVPEPSAALLLALGAGGVAARRSRRE